MRPFFVSLGAVWVWRDDDDRTQKREAAPQIIRAIRQGMEPISSIFVLPRWRSNGPPPSRHGSGTSGPTRTFACASGFRTFAGVARELNDPAELEQAREAFARPFTLFDYGECDLHLRGLPTRAKIKDLHRYWFDTGVPLVVDLRD